MKTGIVHLGLGAFHRAHQAAYTQQAVAISGGDWGIEAVSMRNPALAIALNERGGKYTLIERHPDGPKLIDMTIIQKAHVLPGNVKAVVDRLADAAIRIVTITVTEKGYGAKTGTHQLNRDDPAVAYDIANPVADPRSLPGLICRALLLRRNTGLPGLTLISCDNLPENGQLLHAVVRSMAEVIDPTLADWIDQHCCFPSSMVDRITPASNDATFALAGGDPLAVETEPFTQWVIENRFAGPHPDWQAAGALLVDDVRPFELMKLRLLNGSHSLIAYLGALLDLEMVRDVMADKSLAAAVANHMQQVAGCLPAIPGLDVKQYIHDLLQRFANPAMAHRCLQIATDGSQKLPQRIFSPALDLFAAGENPQSCALTTAIWLQFLTGRSESGQTLPLNDPLADSLSQAVSTHSSDVSALVAAVGELLGNDAARLWAQPNWQAQVSTYVEMIRTEGLRPALQQICAPVNA